VCGLIRYPLAKKLDKHSSLLTAKQKTFFSVLLCPVPGKLDVLNVRNDNIDDDDNVDNVSG
jgi:hypothetical protein